MSSNLYPRDLVEAAADRREVSGRLIGEVLEARLTKGKMRVQFRDKDEQNEVAVEAWVPWQDEPYKRGDMLAVSGRLKLKQRPLGASFSWDGEHVSHLGVAGSHQARVHHIKQTALRLRGSARRLCDLGEPLEQVWVFTGVESRARGDIEVAVKELPEGLVSYRLCKLGSNDSIAWGLRELVPEVRPNHLVIVARGGGDWQGLRRFEHPEVVDALAQLSGVCPVWIAVGHADHHLMLEEIVDRQCTTPSQAGNDLAAWYGGQSSAMHAATRPRQPPSRAVWSDYAGSGAPEVMGALPSGGQAHSWPQQQPATRRLARRSKVAASSKARPVRALVRSIRRGVLQVGAAGALLALGWFVVNGWLFGAGSRHMETDTRAAQRAVQEPAVSDVDREAQRPAHTAPRRKRRVGAVRDKHGRETSTRPATVKPPGDVGGAKQAPAGRQSSERPPTAALEGAVARLEQMIPPFSLDMDRAQAKRVCRERQGYWIAGGTNLCNFPGGRRYALRFLDGRVFSVVASREGLAPVLSPAERQHVGGIAQALASVWTVSATGSHLSVTRAPPKAM